MDHDLQLLLSLAVGLGVMHTAVGVDHTLPFVVLARAQRWPLPRTLRFTTLCGVGHVLSSVLLGAVGLAVGAALAHLEFVESLRGDLASGVLSVFGLAYAAWSWGREGRGHVHELPRPGVTFWSLFLVFVLGPCEPLIPLLMVPALEQSAWATALVAFTFGAATLGTMVLLVTLAWAGLGLAPLHRLEGRANTLAGLAIAASGLAIRLFGI